MQVGMPLEFCLICNHLLTPDCERFAKTQDGHSFFEVTCEDGHLSYFVNEKGAAVSNT